MRLKPATLLMSALFPGLDTAHFHCLLSFQKDGFCLIFPAAVWAQQLSFVVYQKGAKCCCLTMTALLHEQTVARTVSVTASHPIKILGLEARAGFAGGADNVPSTLLDQVSPSATSSEAAAAVPLMNRMPESFNEAFLIVVCYLLADLIPIPENKFRSALPDICCVTSSLAAKAGCPFEWAFLLFLPILATACSKARLLIDEIFLVPPLLWLGLCLESGANKSVAMTALLNIIFAFGNLNVFS